MNDAAFNKLFEEIEELKVSNNDLKVRVLKLEKSVVVKAKKWEDKEDRFLFSLATNVALTKDGMRTRETKFLRMLQAFQEHYERTERAVTMRLDSKYFGKG